MSISKSAMEALNNLHLDNATVSDKNETLETSEKLRVFSTLPTIAKDLGVEETNTTLVPYLRTTVEKLVSSGDDEVLSCIAQKLRWFPELVGASSNPEAIVPVLEILDMIMCKVEEIIVVQSAGDSFGEIIPKCPTQQVTNFCLTFIRKAMEEDLFYASKKVSTDLIVACYPFVAANLQSELKYRLIHIADNEDEVPMIRAAAIQKFVPLIRLSGAEIKNEISSTLSSLVNDSQRIVRSSCLPALLEYGKLCTDTAEFESKFLPIMEKLLDDTNRDTKKIIASSVTDIQTLLTKFSANTAKPFHETMLNLLEDNDIETRKICAAQIEGYCLNSSPQVVTDVLVPRIKEHLVMEKEERVRAELVKNTVRLLPSLKKEVSLPLVQNILSFLNESVSQTKQYVFEHFSDLILMLPKNEVHLTLLPSLLRLWQDTNWRVRLGVVQSVPFLFPSLTEQSLSETVLPATLAWLRDPTWTVRECACRSLARLLKVCPNAAKDALLGTNNTTASKAAATQLTTNADSTDTPANATEGDGKNGSSSVASLTQTAASGGLKALATDPNYHLRQVYILAVQNIWGPGIPDEIPYSASGDDPLPGLINPATGPLGKNNPINNGEKAAVPQTLGQPPSLPAVYLQSCINQLTTLMTEDPVPNVRFCAARALLTISTHFDKKNDKKDIVPILKKLIANDTDRDVKFFAEETLAAFED